MGWGRVALFGLGVVAVAAASSSSSTTPTPTPTPGGSMTKKQRLYAQLESLPMLDEDQRLFLMLVAYGESGFSPTAHNDSQGEVEASERAYDRIRSHFASCPFSRNQYAIGSGGRFGRLVPYFCNDLRSIAPCIDPQAIFDGVHDIVSAIATAHALQGYASWQGTVVSLRAGWATPGWMDAPPASKVEKWTRHANEVHLPAGFINRSLERFPSDLAAVLHALRAGGAVA